MVGLTWNCKKTHTILYTLYDDTGIKITDMSKILNLVLELKALKKACL